MNRRYFLCAGLVAAAILGGCSVQGAGLGDLTGPVPDKATNAAPGIAPGSDGVARLTGYKCTTEPPAPAQTQLMPVPAGPFLMGCNVKVDTECRADEMPTHTVTLNDYAIDQNEVSQIQYYECVKSGACLAPTCDWDPCGTRTNYPVVCVDRDDAATYCEWKHERLPTEAEWEKAARGEAGLKYPWGNDGIDCTKTNMSGCNLGFDGKDGTSPVGSLPAGASLYGALDMAGNVVELVADFYDASYYAMSPAADPTGPAKADAYVGRGGGFRSVPFWHRTSTRDDYEATYFKNSTGFRCAE